MIRVVHPGSRIRMLTFSHPGSRIQGSKMHPIPDPGSATLLLINKKHDLKHYMTSGIRHDIPDLTFQIIPDPVVSGTFYDDWIRNFLKS
jgi:hypothetical protein